MLIHQKLSCGNVSMKFSSGVRSMLQTEGGTETTAIMPDWRPRPGPGGLRTNAPQLVPPMADLE